MNLGIVNKILHFFKASLVKSFWIAGFKLRRLERLKADARLFSSLFSSGSVSSNTSSVQFTELLFFNTMIDWQIDVTQKFISFNFVFPIKVMVGVIQGWSDIRSQGVTLHDCRVGPIGLVLYQHYQTVRKTIQNYFRPFVDSFCVRHETIFTFSMNV